MRCLESVAGAGRANVTRMFRRGRIVEFTGPPGGGKSTLVVSCSEILRERGYRVPALDSVRGLYLRHNWIGRLAGRQVRERDIAGQRLEYFKEVEAPRLLARFRRRHAAGWDCYRRELGVLRERDPAGAEKLERWIDQSALTWMMLRAQARRMDLFLWEEGIAHRAVNLFADPEHPVDADRLGAFLAGWAFPDALVHVQADAPDCVERMATRGLPERLAGYGRDEIRAFVERGAEVSAGIAQEARRRGLPVFDVANRFDSVQSLEGSPVPAALADDLVHQLRAKPRSGA
jgi:hypothetical protein